MKMRLESEQMFWRFLFDKVRIGMGITQILQTTFLNEADVSDVLRSTVHLSTWNEVSHSFAVN